jgi:3-oxoacyl-[acyl-carrier protein] reductase
MNAFDLSGRTAIVTGAGSGIGQATAIRLAEAGARVVCADIDGDAAKATAATITAQRRDATAEQVDVARKDDVTALVDGAPGVDIMANVAGIIHQSSVIDTTEADLDRILSVNLKGVLWGCQAAARRMVEQGSGSIINMASAAIDTPAPNLLCYAMAKAAVTQLTRTLATEVAKAHVRVNAVAPGFVVTGMTSRHFRNDDGTIDEARRDATVEPMRRLNPLQTVGEPDDIAYAVLYLASDASKYMTGQILRPNGGVAMPW